MLASSITYVGFVGILTGVRKDLSMSLNFRGVHNATTRTGHFQFYLHHLLVLFGIRQSISSLLRSHLLGNLGLQNPQPSRLATLMSEIPPKRSTAAYLIFSDGKTTVTMEKDYRTALLRQSKSFIVMTNHDLNPSKGTSGDEDYTKRELASFVEVLRESTDRRECMANKWRTKVTESIEVQSNEASSAPVTTRSGLEKVEVKRKLRDTEGALDIANIEDSVTITNSEVISWVSAWPTTNECTHFAAVLDPTTGQVMWTRQYVTPVDEP